MNAAGFRIGGNVLMIGLLLGLFIMSLCTGPWVFSAMGTARASLLTAEWDEADFITVQAEIEPYVVTSVRNPLLFEIKGSPGRYDAGDAAEYTLEANVPVTVTLTAAPLTFESDQSIELDVLYWVDHETNSFGPGRPAIIHLPYTPYERHTLRLGGRVSVHEVAAQPAGTYRGTIWITVSAGD